MNWINLKAGPAVIITSAFIGPGSLTVCALAGVDFGFELLWAVLLSCLITIFFQNIVANLSYHHNLGLIELLKNKLNNKSLKVFFKYYILITIFFGNAAYEAGNISGALLGLNNISEIILFETSELFEPYLLLIITIFLILVVLKDNIRLLKNVLGIAVMLMSFSFLVAAIITKPNLIDILAGFFIPRWRPETWSTIVAVLGTTIVPYNLFLHAWLVKKEKSNNISFKLLKRDTIIAVSFGGVISASIIIAASGANIYELVSVEDLGTSLNNLYGNKSQLLISFGLFAAGLSSAMTAPLAARYVFKESINNYSNKFKLEIVAPILIIFIGLIFTHFDTNPFNLIKVAQIANGLMLPGITLFILYLCLSFQPKTLNYKIRILGLIILFLFFAFLAFKILFL
ncbi:MAG: manganese transporter [Flavobacteriaceae bacterium]|nr:manganese transporter [Flavobacteriaceae bacterium]|tara:strand:+ start:4689 stop:5888 length:1200 start_codon:yes stop_codon:yes gene_type:complete